MGDASEVLSRVAKFAIRGEGSSRDWGPAAHAWVRPIDDSGTCLLFVTQLSNQVKTLFTLLTNDEGKVDH